MSGIYTSKMSSTAYFLGYSAVLIAAYQQSVDSFDSVLWVS